MFTFDQLAGFIAVAEELHFGRAAERLNMTQPPLSRQIQKLEKTVGAELLERDNRRVQLTPAGTAFLDEARRLLALAERAPVTARRIASGRSGLLRIGFTAASGFSILGPLLEEISAILPDVDVDLQELVTGEQIQALETGELDLGLARPPFDKDKRDEQEGTAGEHCVADAGVPGPGLAALEGPENKQRERDREQPRAQIVDPVLHGLDVLVERPDQHPSGHQAERDVHEENAAPDPERGKHSPERRAHH